MASQEVINEMVNRGNEAMGRGPRPMETAPRDGTHFLAYLYWSPCSNHRGFGEWREIFYKPYQAAFGWHTPWHAGDPFEDGSEHFGEAVPIAWLPLPPLPRGAVFRKSL